MSGDGMMNPDGKQKTDVKDDNGPANEPHKPKVPPLHHIPLVVGILLP